MNEFLKKIKDGEKPVGTFFEIGSITAAECLGRSGFDYMIIDNEHGTFEGESTVDAIRGANLSGIIPFVRELFDELVCAGKSAYSYKFFVSSVFVTPSEVFFYSS